LANAVDAKQANPAISATVNIDRIMFLWFPADGLRRVAKPEV
jgi:hypothetical protein